MITEALGNSVKNASMQSENHIQVWTKSIHGRLAVQTKSQQEQR